MANTYNTLIVDELDHGIVVCSINRPAARNALNEEMVNEFHAMLTALNRSWETTVLVITGSGGKSFMSGADIAELRNRDSSDALRQINNGLFRAVESFRAPTIAAVNGYALGGGCELALACDLRIAASHAKFGQPEVKLGIVPGAGATYRLPTIVGLGKAKELIFTGKIIDADAALQIGLVNEVVELENLRSRAVEVATEIAANGSTAIRLAKLALNTQRDSTIEAGYALETIMQTFLFEHPEKNRRMDDFLNKKKK